MCNNISLTKDEVSFFMQAQRNLANCSPTYNSTHSLSKLFRVLFQTSSSKPFSRKTPLRTESDVSGATVCEHPGYPQVDVQMGLADCHSQSNNMET